MENNEELQEVEKLQVRPFTRFCMSIGAVPSSYLAGLTIEEQLLWLCSYLENEVIPTVNNNGEAVEELQGLYEELHDYVEHYFDNLDVQEEINNKLDEMTTSGQLTYIIKNYVDSVFDPYVEETNADISEFKESVNNQISQTNSDVLTNANNITTLSSRMDTFASLTDGSTSGDAELADARVSYSGLTYSSAGDAIRGQVNLLFNQLNKQNLDFEENQFDGIYIQGLYKSADGTFDSSRTDYISSKNKIYVGDAVRYRFQSVPDNIGTCWIMFYEQDDTFISAHQYSISAKTPMKFPADTYYVRVSLAKTGGGTLAPTNIMPFVLKFKYFFNDTKSLIDTMNKIYGLNNTFDFSNYIYYSSDGTIGTVTNRIGIIQQIQLTQDMEISVDSGYKYSPVFFSQYTGVPDHDYQTEAISWTTSPMTLEKGSIITFNMAKTDDTTINPSDGIHIHLRYKYPDSEPEVLTNYSFDVVNNKHKLSLTKVGDISGKQSFCKYNNNYYITDGSHIYVYDSTFTLTSTVDINLGHGNSMQLGHNGKCYVSGWNDNKIYVVDLSTISITNTINLPTTGYTTGVVDDINNIAYILQRDTNPSNTKEHYNLITYDITNDTILSTKKTPNSFGALQGCDLIDGKILATYGLGGSNDIDNGYVMYDLNGSIIGEYVFGSKTSDEPEGVFVDRDTKELYIMWYNNLYKIS